MTTQEEVTKQLINQDKDMLDLVRQLFNLVKQQREYNLLQDQQIEGLTNRIRKLEKRHSGRYKKRTEKKRDWDWKDSSGIK